MLLLISGCQQPLKFDGLYRAKGNGVFNYLRFYEDGTVLAASLTGTPQDITRWFDKDNIFAKGYYNIDGSRIKYSILDNYSSFDYDGIITRNKIKFKIYNHLNGNLSKQEYRFIPLSLTKDYSDNNLNLNEILTPETERIIIQELKKDLDNDGKMERMVFDADKEYHTKRPDQYRRMLIYNSHNYLVFDSEKAGLDIEGVKFQETPDYLKVEDNNRNGIPEIYLSEKAGEGIPGRIAIIESDQTNYHVLLVCNLENYRFEDLDNDGKLELYGDTGSTTWELLYYMDKTVFKQKGFKYIPFYELTWQQVDKEQSKANEDFLNTRSFDNLQRLITLDAVLGLKEEGLRLIKENFEFNKDPTNTATPKNLTGSFENKIQKYNTDWNRFKASSDWYNLSEQINDLYQQRRYSDALELATKVVTLSKEVFGADHENTAVSLQNLAILQLYLGKVNEATELFKEAALIIDKIVQKGPQSFWDTPYRNLWSDHDFKLAGLFLGMKEPEVLKILGKPIKKKYGTIHEWGDLPELSFKDFLYKGITIRLIQTDKNESYKIQPRIIIKTPRYQTLRQVKVGDSYQKVLLVYGEPTFQNQTEIEYQVMYSYQQSNYWKHLTFKLNPKGNIEMIIIGPVYD
jgi:hypothetical protein